MPSKSLAVPICAFLVCSTLALSAQTLTSQTYGGSGSDAANGIATDSAGNIYLVGTTTSFDLPLLHPAQSQNPGTQLLVSNNAGFSWQPLANLPNPYTPYQLPQTLPIAVDPTNTAVFYVGFNGMVYKTTDSGQHFTSAALIPSADAQEISIAIDPSNPSTLYATAYAPGALFKSIDGGVTWAAATAGIPAGVSISSFVVDPFHPNSLWTVAAGAAYMSTDGANSWTPVTLPSPAGSGGNPLIEFLFDSVTPGTLYVSGQDSTGLFLLKSTNGGGKWAQASMPFDWTVLVADPVRAGYLYALSPSPGGLANLFYRSSNGGVSWQSFPFPSVFASGITLDPGNPNIIIAGSYRSINGGETWSPTMVSRAIQATFAPSGRDLVYASGPITSDIFLAKFKPGGKTLEFATYFGGMGTETAAGVQVDAAGNIWVAGSTNSFDLPVSKNALLKQLKGGTNIFLAEFSPQGQLLASTYLGGSGTDTIAAFRVDANGNPWICGQTSSTDFPLTNGSPPPMQPGAAYVFLAKIDSSASQVLYSTPMASVNLPGGMTIDSDGNVVLTGGTNSSDFPVTANVVHGASPPGQSAIQAFVIKLDSSGNTIFSTYLGGSVGVDLSYLAAPLSEAAQNIGVAVAADATGIYVTGNTSATNFPTTTGAYQTHLKDGCTYFSSAIDTGLIGTIYFYAFDDVFITKLSPDAKTMLYSTLLGGSCYDRPTDIAVTPAGAVFVAGETNSIDFPLLHPTEGAPAIQNYESFVSMISANGAALDYSTYLLAGSAPTLAVSPDGVVHIAGSAGFDAQTMTFSGFPFPPPSPDTKAYLAALDVSGTPAELNLTGVLNDFSLLTGPVAAGEIVELTVPDFKPAQDINVGINERLPLGTTLGGTQVLFDGKPAQVMSIASGKIVAIAPQHFANNQTTTIQVNANGALSNPLQMDIAPAALGLLSADGSGTGLANARNEDGTLNSASNPAKRGTRITVFFTGAGVPPAAISLNFPDIVGIAPLQGFVPGIYSLNFRVPTSLSYTSPLGVTLMTPGASQLVAGSTSQTLTIYMR
jgi:uncharacterized protein (TIGR03437 family)